jgi:hypothetical protein
MTTETVPEAPKRDFYFSFTDEASADTALQPFYYQPVITSVDEETGETVETPDGDPYLVMNSHNHSFDIVGLIYEATGVMLTDAEGNEYPEMAPIPGWHVNLRIRGDYMRDDAEAIDATDGVSPVTPHRTWL